MPPNTITILVDNNATPELIAEHGFSTWIEHGNDRILFDTGQGGTLATNARELGVNLDEATLIALSHGHYDHTGGLGVALSANSIVRVAYGVGCTRRRFSCHEGRDIRDIGMPQECIDRLESLSESRRLLIDRPFRLHAGIGITGPIPRRIDFEDTGGPFFFDQTRQSVDPISDEIAVWIETEEGLVIITGCCHAGIINTVEHIREISGQKRVQGIIGGLHLLHASEQRIQATFDYLTALQPKFMLPCHCTGEHVVAQMKKRFGTQVVECKVGTRLQLIPPRS